MVDIDPWPALTEWADTCATLHMWTQIVGKMRLALTPPVNHWWHTVLYVTARGLTTSPMPYRGGTVEMTFDFVDHSLVVETSDGATRRIALAPQTVAEFYDRVMRTLHDLGIDVRIWPMPGEVAEAVR